MALIRLAWPTENRKLDDRVNHHQPVCRGFPPNLELRFYLGSGAPAEAVGTLESQLFTVPSYYTKYRDIAGHIYNLPPNHQITIGYKPGLLE